MYSTTYMLHSTYIPINRIYFTYLYIKNAYRKFVTPEIELNFYCRIMQMNFIANQFYGFYFYLITTKSRYDFWCEIKKHYQKKKKNIPTCFDIFIYLFLYLCYLANHFYNNVILHMLHIYITYCSLYVYLIDQTFLLNIKVKWKIAE